MFRVKLLFLNCMVAASAVVGFAVEQKSFEFVKNQTTPSFDPAPLRVDLGYAVYDGFMNKTSGLNTWKGIRFAALGTTLFTNAISASPFLPRQHAYDDAIPTQAYTTFAARAGCMSNTADDTFDCLVTTDTLTLQKASANVSESGVYGTWGFLPVTDGVFIQQRPSQQLVDKRVNGRTILVGNNAHEGLLFTPQSITSSDDLYAWLKTTLPLFTESDLANAIHEYSEEGSVDVPDALDSPSTRAQRTADVSSFR
ncbi:carboxylesterase 2 [Colletotrichum tofieldiae]|nr:carboxylesterase 2 [Colletotrichum tofieldiae]